jgi:quinol monooxygenase YgiN
MIYIVTYVDVQRSSVAAGRALIQRYGDASRAGAGNCSVELFQEISRPNRFVAVEVWQDSASFDQHKSAEEAVRFRDGLKSIYTNPCDERLHQAFVVDSAAPATAGEAIGVVTHVDVPPPRKDEAEVLLRRLAEESRRDDGNLRYDIFQQMPPRTNHFTTAAVWKNAAAFESHEAQPHRVQLREALWPILGAPYDERVYTLLSSE